AENECIIGLTQTSCRLNQRVEHRLQIECRATDHLEHVGGGGLLLEGFAELVEQPRILDRDHCLIGERFNQLDLFGGEWRGFRTRQRQRPDWISFSQKRNSKISPILSEFLRFEERVFRVGKNIGNIYCFASERSSSDGFSASWSDRMALVILSELAR